MDDLGAAEAPPEGAASWPLSEPTPTPPPPSNVSPTGEEENADPLQVRLLEFRSNARRVGSRYGILSPYPRRVGRLEALNGSL